MKALIFLLFVTPVFACKLVSEKDNVKGQQIAAINAVKALNKSQHFLAKKVGLNLWSVRSKKPTCIEYKVQVTRHPDCNLSTEVISEMPCK